MLLPHNATTVSRMSSTTGIMFATLLILRSEAIGLCAEIQEPQVLVCGATPAGIAAALAAAEDGCTVLLTEPSTRIGGLVTSGLSHTDFHSRESLSGAYLRFANRVDQHYAEAFGADSPQRRDCHGGVFAEPKVNLAVFTRMLSEVRGITLQTRYELITVQTTAAGAGQRISAVTFRDADGIDHRVHPQVIIDATYDGDLMAMASVRWRAGREGRHEYAESLAPESADDQLQAFNFRFVMTRDPQNRVTPAAPEGYRRDDFVAVLPALESDQIDSVFGYPRRCIFKAHEPPLPNAKYDINDVSGGLIRLSLPGQNAGWPSGTAAERRQIFQNHLRDQAGLLYFLQNDPEVPDRFRQEALQWGWCRDEFPETGHLPPQLYVRESRRMEGLRVFTLPDCEHATDDARAILHPDSIAMGDYGNNCHGTSHEGPRFGGRHTGEFYNPVPPYQIPYGTLLPQELSNLLVPVACSASHVGFCALRLEPIWMSMGQAAGHAAAIAAETRLAVQDVPIARLQARLHAVGSATVYVSDVLPGDPDFSAIQWWGTLGGFHGLAPMPEKPGQRGRNLHGQYFAANPGHAAEPEQPIHSDLATRWSVLAKIAGLSQDQIPEVTPELTRRTFIRKVYSEWVSHEPRTATERAFRLHRSALQNTHPPGEVDKPELVASVVSDLKRLPGIVLDDSDAELVGDWQYSSHTPPWVGRGYLHDRNTGKGRKSATFRPAISAAGRYEVRLSHCYNVRRATNTSVLIQHADGDSTIQINQQDEPEHGRLFRTLGTFRFAPDTARIEISNSGTDGKYVIVDAVQLLPVD